MGPCSQSCARAASNIASPPETRSSSRSSPARRATPSRSSDVLFAGDGGELKSTDGLTVSAEIIAQAKADKVTVFKKKRRHNYRRKRGHRQQLTILKIVAIGGKNGGRRRRPSGPAAKAEGSPPPRPKPEAPAKGGASAEAP